jgi:hypothetical protein
LANVSVSLGEYGTHRPPPTEPGGENLRRIYDQGTAFIMGTVPGLFEQAGAYFLFGAAASRGVVYEKTAPRSVSI